MITEKLSRDTKTTVATTVGAQRRTDGRNGRKE